MAGRERVAPISVKGGVMVIVKDVTGNGYLVVTNTKEHVRLVKTGVFVQGVAIVLRDVGLHGNLSRGGY